VTRVPVVSGEEAVRAFVRLGYKKDHRPAVTSSFDTLLRPSAGSPSPIIENFHAARLGPPFGKPA
jgi:hypothetical protein